QDECSGSAIESRTLRVVRVRAASVEYRVEWRTTYSPQPVGGTNGSPGIGPKGTRARGEYQTIPPGRGIYNEERCRWSADARAAPREIAPCAVPDAGA